MKRFWKVQSDSRGGEATVRWNDIANGSGHGVFLEPWPGEDGAVQFGKTHV